MEVSLLHEAVKSMFDNLNTRKKIPQILPNLNSLQTSLFRATYWVGEKVHSVSE